MDTSKLPEEASEWTRAQKRQYLRAWHKANPVKLEKVAREKLPTETLNQKKRWRRKQNGKT